MSNFSELATAVVKQFNEEVGEPSDREHKTKHKAGHGVVVPHDSSCQACRDVETSQMLRQKYGLAAPVLTDEEKMWVVMEERLGC